MQQRAEELYEQWKCGSTGTTLDGLTLEQPDVVADFVAIIFQHETWTRGSQVVTGLMNRYAKKFADGAQMRNELCDELYDLRQKTPDEGVITAESTPLTCPMCGREPGEPRPITVDEGIACDHCRNWLTPHPVDPYHCPNCGSDELDDESEPEPLDEDDPDRISTQRIGCTACGWHWKDVYTVKGYIEPEEPGAPPAVITLKGFDGEPTPADVQRELDSGGTLCPMCDCADIEPSGELFKCGECGWLFSAAVTCTRPANPIHPRTDAGTPASA